jgi:hypothetical protein
MHLIIDEQINKDAIILLIEALEIESFSIACCVKIIDDEMVYLKCPNSRHGVIVDIKQLNPDVVIWAVECLKKSVTLF